MPAKAHASSSSLPPALGIAAGISGVLAYSVVPLGYLTVLAYDSHLILPTTFLKKPTYPYASSHNSYTELIY